VGPLSIGGSFDLGAFVSKLPHDLIATLTSSASPREAFPISVFDGDVSFSTVLKMEAADIPVVVLGQDWFALYKEHLLASNINPSMFKQFAGVRLMSRSSGKHSAYLDICFFTSTL
ncbi:hypothetical protein C0992_005079, partial [Termitomyces sp. T32_za158]